MIAKRYSILHPTNVGMGYWIEVSRMNALFEADSFDAVPPGWRKDPAREGEWSAEGGELVGRVGANLGPTMLWFEAPIAGNHAVYYRATIVPGTDGTEPLPLAGELLAYWNGDGRSGGAQPWSLVLGAINGWRGDYSGMEYLASAGGTGYESQGVMATQAFGLERTHSYELFAGRLDDVDFLFGAPVNAKGHTGPWVSITQDILAATSAPPACHLGVDARVAIGTAAFDDGGVELRVQAAAVFQIPASAVEPWAR